MSYSANDALIVAFIQGAKWWEYHKTGATMWQSDQHEAEREANCRAKNQTLGRISPNAELSDSAATKLSDRDEQSAQSKLTMDHKLTLSGCDCENCVEARRKMTAENNAGAKETHE